MDSAIVLVIIAFIALCLLKASMYIVPQQNMYIIERFGKYLETADSGLHFKIPLVDKVASKMPLRTMQLNVAVETKTQDNVFIDVAANVQYRVEKDNVKRAFYELDDPEAQLRSYLEDALRSALPKLSLDDAFAKKDDIAQDVQSTIQKEMDAFGYSVQKTLVTSIDPSDEIKKSMDAINAAQRKKAAAKENAEAARITVVTQAEADAEKNRQQGKGQADYRREIANGLVDQIKSLGDAGMDAREINNVVMFNQYLDTVRALVGSNGSNTILLPASTPGGYQDLFTQMTAALSTAGNSTRQTVDDALSAVENHDDGAGFDDSGDNGNGYDGNESDDGSDDGESES